MGNVKQAKHPLGDTVLFYEDIHKYEIAGSMQELVSTTTFLGRFFPEFDAPMVAAKCAASKDNKKYYGRDPAEIMAEWEAETERGRNEGTNTHNWCEARLKSEPLPKPISPRCEKLFACAERAIVQLSKHYEFIDAEMIIVDLDNGIAGMIDLVMRHKTSGIYLILDWKQNKEISMSNQWQKGLTPIMNLDDCDFNKYSLQLTSYKHTLITQRYFPDAIGWKLGLIHLREYGGPLFLPVAPMDREYGRLLKRR